MSSSRERLERLSSGFMPARVLITALELDLFSVLGAETMRPGEIARRTRCKSEFLERLLNALVALGLLKKVRGEYSNTGEGLRHLTADAAEPLGDIIRHRGSMWETWSRLTEVVRTGRVPRRRRGLDRERRFIKGMANIGRSSARETAGVIQEELKSAKKLLDVGGGPAVYACEFARRVPGLKVTVLDLPGPLQYARKTIRSLGMEDRVRVRAGDVLGSAALGRGYDVVFLSNLIHAFKGPVARKVVEKAANAAKRGGHLIVKDFFLSREGTHPRFCALFSINMLVAGGGDCFPRREVEEWMAAAGVKPSGYRRVSRHSGILVGKKM